MQPTAPMILNVRLSDADKQNFVKVAAAAERAAGVRMSNADVYRNAIQALAEKLNVKVK